MNGSFDRMAYLAFKYSFYFSLAALIILFFYAAGEARCFGEFWAISGILVSLALGCAGAGGIIGFLFGIPHTLQETTRPAAATPAPAPAVTPPTGTGAVPTTPGMSPVPAAAPAPATPAGAPPPAATATRNTNYGRSTNLEQIADWLTKIIVGVGLVEIHKIVRLVSGLCVYIGGALKGEGASSDGAVIAGSVMAAFFVAGFLIAYLWTYLYLLEIQANMDQRIRDAVNATIQDNDLHNKSATDLANTQLNLPENAADIPDSELAQAFASAGTNVCSIIFFTAVSWRKQFYRDPAMKFRVARTIPIFRALISTDSHFEYPENYLQLGYALKDQVKPDYAAALKNIDLAINSFDRANGRIVNVALAYFNRAFCRIKLELAVAPAGPSTVAQKQLIDADLATAAQDPGIAAIIAKDPDVLAWKNLNP